MDAEARLTELLEREPSGTIMTVVPKDHMPEDYYKPIIFLKRDDRWCIVSDRHPEAGRTYTSQSCASAARYDSRDFIWSVS